MATARGEITISEAMCLGCGFCAKFCNRGCLVWPSGKFTPEGYLLPVFTNPERCTACELCAWMCPHFAIEVYKYADERAAVKGGKGGP